ncbi:hypothetical protein QQG74_09235 [Micromonospora sp. FIMYZ51]|uniref:hypothetical protein n=1 Tax=Micromonospora sp. FIMYZ51 TaxID=3051832 RepID=UPI00311F15FE
MAAADALRGDQQTFSRAQVAHLISLAFQSGRELGIEEGHRERNDALAEGLRLALGGPDARDMGDAVSRHLRQVDQKQRRTDSDRQARQPRPHGLRLVDPNWPPVTEPGSVTVEQARAISARIWRCPCRRHTERHWLDGYHRTPEPFPGQRHIEQEAA